MSLPNALSFDEEEPVTALLLDDVPLAAFGLDLDDYKPAYDLTKVLITIKLLPDSPNAKVPLFLIKNKVIDGFKILEIDDSQSHRELRIIKI